MFIGSNPIFSIMYLLLIFFPFIASFLSGFLAKYFGSKGASKITVLCMLLSFSLIIIILFEVISLESSAYITLFYWIDSEYLNVHWGFIFDSLTVKMCFIVITVSLTVHIYSIEYMYYDPFLSKFMSYLSLFTFFMLILVTGDNIIQMFIGWEGVGLCSFLLINFWFIRIQANKAAIKAMVLNRIGDFGLLIGILFIFVNFKAVDYITINYLISFFKTKTLMFNFNLIDMISLSLFIGCTGKSAQLGLHTWLPDAMEGPTPVSALIHAATMVTAGIFLIIRMSFLFEHSYKIYKLLILVGNFTLIIAAIIGIVQNDVKKIVAYSTCSQLGYMILACGLNDYNIALFHLINHAFFKALLFLGSGSIIHSICDEQDIRKMGGLKQLLPFTYIIIIIGSLALTGFPFLAGFYSKDMILESSISKYNVLSTLCFIVGTSGAFITAYYSFRSIFFIFIVKPNGFRCIINFSTESQVQIQLSLIILSFPSIIVGFYAKDLLIGFGSNFFNNVILINIQVFNLLETELISLFYKLLPVFVSLLGIIFSFYNYYSCSYLLFKTIYINFFKQIYNFFNRKWFFDKIYNELLSQFFFKLGYSISYKFIDKGIFEYIGPTGLSFISLNFSLFVNMFQTNHIYHILFTTLISLTFLIFQIFCFNMFNFNVVIINVIIILILS